jgi:hypothetical protein
MLILSNLDPCEVLKKLLNENERALDKAEKLYAFNLIPYLKYIKYKENLTPLIWKYKQAIKTLKNENLK